MADPADGARRGPAEAAAPDDGARVLSQDEIDGLLGLAGAAEGDGSGGAARCGGGALVGAPAASHERLPMLEVVFDRFVRILTTSLRDLTSGNVEVNLEGIGSVRIGDYLDSVPRGAMIAVFKAVEWDNHGLVTVDGALVYSVLEVLLGGRRGATPLRVEGRPFTTIERALIERLVRVVLADVGAAFEPVSRVEFRFERLETNPRFAAVARSANAAVVFRLRIEMEDRGGAVEILIPYATLEPVRELLLQMFMGEKFGRDSIWENHLAREMWVTDLGLEAVLDEQTLPLGQVVGLAVGSTLTLGARPDSPVRLRCGGVPLLVGRIGRVGDTLAVRVEGDVPARGGGRRRQP
ncbi:MAG TPA: flagellar motor switch protein FliM [Geminicoccaceae bacterium]|nr:flagellar motor switch protein FliM [Geminicoccaceae bacterium]